MKLCGMDPMTLSEVACGCAQAVVLIFATPRREHIVIAAAVMLTLAYGGLAAWSVLSPSSVAEGCGLAETTGTRALIRFAGAVTLTYLSGLWYLGSVLAAQKQMALFLACVYAFVIIPLDMHDDCASCMRKRVRVVHAYNAVLLILALASVS